MAYFKYIPYFFLLIAILFIVEAVDKYNEGREPWPYVLLAAGAVAMFFIRKKSYRRFDNNHKN